MLRLLAKGHSAGQAAAAIGCSRQCVYDWRAGDDALRLAWDDAVDQATEAIESVLYRKAKSGDLLACIFWLKSHRPAIYNRRQVIAVGGDPDNPIGVRHTLETVHIYMPSNGRDQPEVLEDESPATIEGDVEAA